MGITGSSIIVLLEGTVGSFCASASMVVGSCPPVSMVETSLARGDLNAVGCGTSRSDPLGISFVACLANNSLTVGAWSSELQPQEPVSRSAWTASGQEWSPLPVVFQPEE